MKEDCKEELPEKYTAKLLYRWDDRKFDKEYWGRLERNWRQQRLEQTKGREILEIIQKRDCKGDQNRAPGETSVNKQTLGCIYNSPLEETSENEIRLLEGNLHYI